MSKYGLNLKHIFTKRKENKYFHVAMLYSGSHAEERHDRMKSKLWIVWMTKIGIKIRGVLDDSEKSRKLQTNQNSLRRTASTDLKVYVVRCCILIYGKRTGQRPWPRRSGSPGQCFTGLPHVCLRGKCGDKCICWRRTSKSQSVSQWAMAERHEPGLWSSPAFWSLKYWINNWLTTPGLIVLHLRIPIYFNLEVAFSFKQISQTVLF